MDSHYGDALVLPVQSTRDPVQTSLGSTVVPDCELRSHFIEHANRPGRTGHGDPFRVIRLLQKSLGGLEEGHGSKRVDGQELLEPREVDVHDLAVLARDAGVGNDEVELVEARDRGLGRAYGGGGVRDAGAV